MWMTKSLWINLTQAADVLELPVEDDVVELLGVAVAPVLEPLFSEEDAADLAGSEEVEPLRLSVR